MQALPTLPRRRPPAGVPLPALTTLGAALIASLIAGCGGGKDNAPGAAKSTVTISGRAVDGALQGALACYDRNDDGRCAADEPHSAPTAADGSFSIEVAPADAGAHGVVVEVPANAVDADTGAAVEAAFVLRAPASGTRGAHEVFVSPLTTLVVAHMQRSGVARDEAAALVQAQAGLAISPLADYTAAGDAAAHQAALVARLVQLTAFEQTAGLTGVVGTADRSGAEITTADLEREVQRSLIAALPAVAGALTDPGVPGASGAALQSTLRVLARALAAQIGLSAEAVRSASALERLGEPAPPETPVATAALGALRYTDADNWFMRTLRSSAADNVADASGYIRYTDVRLQSAGNAVSPHGVVQGWAVSTSPARAGDLHWDGSAWVGCTMTDRMLSRVRDAQGRGDYNYCKGWESGTGVRRLENVSGKTLLDVVSNKIRTFAGSAAGVAFANWGPSNLGLLGSATFPTGSYLIYQSNTITATAYSYDVQDSNAVVGYTPAVAAGGDYSANPSLACGNTSLNNITSAVTTLEQLMSLNHGTPCRVNPGGVAPNVSLVPNEWWGNSTINLGDVAAANTLPAGTGNYYNTTASLRVGFAASGNRVSFYRCYRRASDSSPRNCSLLGIGTWSIQTLGDARVLSFSTPPALAQRLSYVRNFVERGGKVYYGWKNPLGTTNTDLRLNLTAGNAVLRQLGLPSIHPVTEPGTATGTRAAALATLTGVWGGFDPNTNDATVFRFGANGRFFMAEAKPYLPDTREQAGAELGWLDYDPVTRNISTLLEVDSNLTSGTSNPGVNEPPVTITANQLIIGTGEAAYAVPRLPTSSSPTNLLGLWAMGSATDLSVPHLAFFSNGRFMLITHSSDPQCIADNQCPPGVEYSDFSYDVVTGQVQLFNKLYDTNGCDGAFGTCPGGPNNTTETVTITIAADGKTATLVGTDLHSHTLYRVDSGSTGPNVAFVDEFNGTILDAQRWAVSSAGGNDAAISVGGGVLAVQVPGGSNGYLGVTDGSHLVPQIPAFGGDFEMVLSASEVSRTPAPSQHDLSGVRLYYGGTWIGLIGNYAGYDEVGYGLYIGHRIEARAPDGSRCMREDSFALDALVRTELRIRRAGSTTMVGYRLEGATDWVELPCTLPGSGAAAIDVFSGDGGYTTQNGAVQLNFDRFELRTAP